MKKFVILLIALLIVFGFVGQSGADPILTSLRITDDVLGHAIEWNTFPDNAFSPIGVSSDKATLLNSPDKSININLTPGVSLYLFTESFKGTSYDLFSNNTYDLFIGVNGSEPSIANFKFNISGTSFTLLTVDPSFTLAFLGFTSVPGLVQGSGGSSESTITGLSPGGGADAIYKLTYTAVPKPMTLLFLGAGLVGLVVMRRRMKK